MVKIILSILFAILNTFSIGLPSSAKSIPLKSSENNLAATSNSTTASIISKAGSTTVIDDTNMLIYGLYAGINKTDFTSNCIQVVGDAVLKIENINGIFATGTKVSLCNSTTNEVLKTYEIVIFGDVNGDANIDSIDAGKIVDFQNYIFSWDHVTDKALYKAGDLNGDGNIDSIDAGIIVDSENYILKIDQTIGRIYTPKIYNVVFKDYNGLVISAKTVEEGKDASLPANPIRTGYVFVGWSGSYKNITANTNLTALYVANSSKNIFTLSSISGNVGDTVTLMLTLSGTVQTCGFDMRLNFDNSVLEFVSFNSEQNLDVVANYIASTSTIAFNFGQGNNITKSKNVISVTFKIRDTAVTDTVVSLSAVEVIFADTNNNNLPTAVAYTLVNGVVFRI